MKKSICNYRRQAFVQQHGRCFYCQHRMWIQNPHQFAKSIGLSVKVTRALQCTAEHLHPVSAGGNNSSTNIVAACRFCNQTRHRATRVKSPNEYAAHVQRRVNAQRWHPWTVREATYAQQVGADDAASRRTDRKSSCRERVCYAV